MEESFIYKDTAEYKPGKGKMLLAEPLQSESIFSRSVVILLDNDHGKGFFGLMLNKRLSYTMSDIFHDWEPGEDIPIYSGGPVEGDRLFMLHTIGDKIKNSVEVLPGLWVGGSLEDVVEYISIHGYNDDEIRFLLGYSGWGEGQLEMEIKRHHWAVKDVSNVSRLLKGSGVEYWRREVGDMGESYRSWLIVPPDSRMN